MATEHVTVEVPPVPDGLPPRTVVETAWYEYNGQQFHVEVGSEAHANLVAAEARQIGASPEGDPDDWTAKELRAYLTDHGQEVARRAKRDDMLAQVQAHMAGTPAESE